MHHLVSARPPAPGEIRISKLARCEICHENEKPVLYTVETHSTGEEGMGVGGGNGEISGL